MIEAERPERSHLVTLERGKIRRSYLNRMRAGEVLTVIDFEELLDFGAKEADLHRLPNIAIGRYKEETLFFDRTVSPIRFEEAIDRIDSKSAA